MDERDKPKFRVIEGGGENSKSSPSSPWEREIKNEPAVYTKLLGPNASELDRMDLKRRIAFVRNYIFNEILREHGADAANTLDHTPDQDHSYFLEDGRLRVRYYFNNNKGYVVKAEKTVTRGCQISNYASLKDRRRKIIHIFPESSGTPPSNEQE
jgi:hypothetical protein